MKRVRRKLTAMLNAMTFAEAGEREAAIEYLEQGAPKNEADAVVEAASSAPVNPGKRNLFRRLEDHMVAATFAEAGELETARAMLLTEGRPKAVLLVMDGHPTDSDAFRYALNLCKRIGAGMEILAFASGLERSTSAENPSRTPSEYERATVWSLRAEEHGVPCTVTMQAGSIDEHLFHYVRLHKEIAAVIYGSQSTRKTAGSELGVKRALERIVARLAIPMVKVLGKRPVGVHP